MAGLSLIASASTAPSIPQGAVTEHEENIPIGISKRIRGVPDLRIFEMIVFNYISMSAKSNLYSFITQHLPIT